MSTHPVFLSTDIVNSSVICRLLGDAAYKEQLFDPHWKILTDCLSTHNGNFYEHKGDGLIATFNSIVEALAYAIEIQKRLNSPILKYNDNHIEIRIGIHRSEVPLELDESGKYRTGELNYVCRIESIANGNQILVSDSSLSSQIKKEHNWLEWQNRRIKSFDDAPITVWELLWDGNSRGMPGSSWAPDWFTGDVSEYVARPELENQISAAYGSKKANSFRLVTLHGSGGTGKTRLALTSAVKMAGLFDGHVHFITFHQKPGEVSDGGDLLLQELRNTLNCGNAKLETVLIALALRGNSLFLIDNFESIAGESVQEVIVKILQRTREVRLLVTGQRKVDLPDSEYVIELQNGMTEDEGVTLFLQRANTLHHNWQPSSEELSAIKHIVNLVEKVPLRIEFAAAWLRKRDLKTIIKELETTPLGKFSAIPSGDRLAATTRDHHKSSELCMEYTCSLLSERQRAHFYRLGLFGGTFTIEQIESVCGISDADDLIDSLLEASLITRFGNLQEYRYSMHRLTMSYCAQRLREQDNWQELALGYVRGFSLLSGQISSANAIKELRNVERVRIEWLNLSRACLLGIEINAVEETVKLMENLSHFVRVEENWSESVELYETLYNWYSKLTEEDYEVITSLLWQIGVSFQMLGHYPRANEYFSKLLKKLESVNNIDLTAICKVLERLSFSEVQLDNFYNAEQYCLHAIALLEQNQNSDRIALAHILATLGRVYQETSRYDEAHQLFLRSLSIFEQFPDKETKGYSDLLNKLGSFYSITGKFEEAKLLFEQAITIVEKSQGSHSCESAIFMDNLGTMYNRANKHEVAIQWHEKALAIFEKKCGEYHPDTAACLSTLAANYFEIGVDEKALNCYNRALNITLRIYGRNNTSVAFLYNHLATYHMKKNEWNEANRLLSQALDIARPLLGDSHSLIAHFLGYLGYVLRHQNKLVEAEKLLQQALAIDEKTFGHFHLNTAGVIGELGQVNLAQGKYDEAERYVRMKIEVLEKVSGKDEIKVAENYAQLAEVLEKLNRIEEAEQMRQQALCAVNKE